MGRLPHILLIAIAGLHGSGAVAASAIDVEIKGVDGALRDNVAAFLSVKRYADAPDLDQDRVDRLALRAPREATDALRPFGYYEAAATVTAPPNSNPCSRALSRVRATSLSASATSAPTSITRRTPRCSTAPSRCAPRARDRCTAVRCLAA